MMGQVLCLDQDLLSVLVYEKSNRLPSRAHVLNLVISSSFKNIPTIRNLFDDVNQLTWFLGASPKRVSIMKRHLPDAKQADFLIGNIENEVTESTIVFCKHPTQALRNQMVC